MNLADVGSFDELVLLITKLSDEKSKRILLGKAAEVYGYGGKAHIIALSGTSYPTLSAGQADSKNEAVISSNRIRREGGGRKPITETIPGITDIIEKIIDGNTGFVNLGTSHDTSEFAVSSISCWWNAIGKNNFRGTKRIYITCDGGGSNGFRNRNWKYELQQFSNDTGLEIMVSHYPPGASKWNKIEHQRNRLRPGSERSQPVEPLEVAFVKCSNRKEPRRASERQNLDEEGRGRANSPVCERWSAVRGRRPR